MHGGRGGEAGSGSADDARVLIGDGGGGKNDDERDESAQGANGVAWGRLPHKSLERGVA